MTLPCVIHSCSPWRLWPSKVAPNTGPSKPSCHSQAWHSSDHSPMRVTSEMAAYTSSGGAAMSREMLSVLDMGRSPPQAPDAHRVDAAWQSILDEEAELSDVERAHESHESTDTL